MLLYDGDYAQDTSGTPEYLAPETLNRRYDKRVDYWALGIILYQMRFGTTPFYHRNSDQMYDNICSAPVIFPNKKV